MIHSNMKFIHLFKIQSTGRPKHLHITSTDKSDLIINYNQCVSCIKRSRDFVLYTIHILWTISHGPYVSCHISKYICNITRLYLNDCRLTKLPNFLSQLTNIQERNRLEVFCHVHLSCIQVFLSKFYAWTQIHSKKYPKQESFSKNCLAWISQ